MAETSVTPASRPRTAIVPALLWCLRHWRLLSTCAVLVLLVNLWSKEKKATQHKSNLESRVALLESELKKSGRREGQFEGAALLMNLQLTNASNELKLRTKQLALLTAIANQQYPNDPEGMRIDLLLKTMAISALSANEMISAQALQRIKGKLDFADRVTVRVYVTGDGRPQARLAAIIAQTFRECGYSVAGPDPIEDSTARGLSMTTKKDPKGLLSEALVLFFTEMSQKPVIKTGQGSSDAGIEITVGEIAPSKVVSPDSKRP